MQLVDSEHIDADRLLRLVPAGQLLEVRALLLERFGRHQEILRWVFPARLCCNPLCTASLSSSLELDYSMKALHCAGHLQKS